MLLKGCLHTLLVCLILCIVYIPSSLSSIHIKPLPHEQPKTYPYKSSSLHYEEDWNGEHSAVLDGDQGNVVLYWSIIDDYIYFKVECRCTGWVALGLSHTKSIKGADLAIGWISSNGQVVMKDYHSVDGRRVEEDISQDLELLYGEELEGSSILRFRRKLNTCDTDQDIVVTNDTFRVIWAYSRMDPGRGEQVNW